METSVESSPLSSYVVKESSNMEGNIIEDGVKMDKSAIRNEGAEEKSNMTSPTEEFDSIGSKVEEDNAKILDNNNKGEEEQQSSADEDKMDENESSRNIETGDEDMKKEEEVENKEKEIKVPKKKAKRNIKPKPISFNGAGTGRERKQVDRFSVPITPSRKKAYEQPVDALGEGIKLQDIPFIAEMINTTAHTDLSQLYSVCFGKTGKPLEIKRHLRGFSGFPFDSDSDEFQKRKTLTIRWDIRVLKQIFKILGISQVGGKDAIVEKLLEFCLKPEDSGKTPPEPKSKPKRRSSSSKKKQSSKSKSKSSKDGKGKKRKHDSDAEESENEEESEKSESDEPTKAKRSKSATTPKKGSEEDDPEVIVDDKKKKRKQKSPKAESATSSKKVSKQISESDNDDDEDEVKNYDMSTISDRDLKRIVKRIINKADLNDISVKKIMDQIKVMFKLTRIEKDKKNLINSFIDEIVPPNSQSQ